MNRIAALLPVTLVFLTAGCMTGWNRLPAEEIDTIRKNSQPLHLDSAGRPVGATLLPDDRAVYVIGETHGVAVNEELDFALLTYLYETAGVRTYIAEVGYSAGRYYDMYVTTGDRKLLDQVFSSLRGTAARTEERYAFWERLAAFNAGRAEDDRIRVVGLDVEHQYAVGISYLYALFSDKTAPFDVREPLDELGKIISENAWYPDRCEAAVESLQSDFTARHEAYAGYLQERLQDFECALQSLIDGFAYRNGRGAKAETARDRAMYERIVKLEGSYPGAMYGKFGAEHIYPRQNRRIPRLGRLLDDIDSPFHDRVVPMLIVYEQCSRLYRDRDGLYTTETVHSPPGLLSPLLDASGDAGQATLFRLAGDIRFIILLRNSGGAALHTSNGE